MKYYIECFQNTTPDLNNKLLLCSRDIEVGDEVWYPRKDGVLSKTIINDEDGISGLRTFGNSFKIIGKISTDAVWVKKGDEFEEDEVKIMYGLEFTAKGGRGGRPPVEKFLFGFKPNDEDAEDMASSWSRNFGNWDSVRIEWDISKTFISYIKIKCPTCKQFH